MSFIDQILALFGLQRKTSATSQSEPQPTSTIDTITRMQHQSVDELMLAGTELTASVYHDRAQQLSKWAQEIREGQLSPEGQAFIAEIFHSQAAKLTPEIEQALREALEKRGRENEEPPADEKQH